MGSSSQLGLVGATAAQTGRNGSGGNGARELLLQSDGHRWALTPSCLEPDNISWPCRGSAVCFHVSAHLFGTAENQANKGCECPLGELEACALSP